MAAKGRQRCKGNCVDVGEGVQRRRAPSPTHPLGLGVWCSLRLSPIDDLESDELTF